MVFSQRATLQILHGPVFAIGSMHAGGLQWELLSGRTEDFRFVCYNLTSSCTDVLFHAKALDEPKSCPSESHSCSQSPSFIPLIS